MRTPAKPGRIPARYSRMGIPRRRQLSVTDRMEATRGPAVGLPMWIQFFLPIATPRMEFSARLLLSSTVSVRPSASFQTMHAFDAVEVWANNNNDQGGGEGVKKPTSWQPNVRRAG